MAAYKGLTWSGFFLRLLVAFMLVFSTYNPSGYSYYHWVVENISSPTPWMALVGILLLIGWAGHFTFPGYVRPVAGRCFHWRAAVDDD
jgi:hypothetical protein